MEPEPGSPRARIAIAAGAAGLLAIVVVAALALGGGEEELTPVPAECVSAWNRDAAATSYGRHNFNFHQYDGALVTYLSESAVEVESADEGLCAVIFPAEALDPEPFAAGQVRQAGEWFPISTLPDVELTRVGELQVTAAGAPNTILDERGEITPLDG
jgi:hypothetical protein